MTRLKVANQVINKAAHPIVNATPIGQRKPLSASASSAITQRRASHSHLDQGASAHPTQTRLVQTHRSLEQSYRLERRCLS